MAVTLMLSRLLKRFLKPFQSAHAMLPEEQVRLRLAIQGLTPESEFFLAKHEFTELNPADELACMRQEISKAVLFRESKTTREVPDEDVIDEEVIDEEVIQQICQYDDGLHGDTLAELIGLYLALAPKRIENLKRALDERNWHAVSKEAHSLKSSSANLGLKKVIGVCRKLEAIENHPNYSMASTLFSEIEREYRAAAHSLMELLKRRVPARKAAA
jgi:HPt (histidine-containing phosphotransfer) domain-containing protein